MIKENNESENPEKNYKLFKKCYEKLEITEDQLEEFEKLTSDEERINFINEIVSYEKLPFIKIIENTKDEKLARDLKELGNEAFRKANFSESLNYYTKSIMETPQKESKLTFSFCFIT